jgi:hypothetical protein
MPKTDGDPKPMWVSAHVQYSVKNSPKGQGVVEGYTFGKDTPVDLETLLVGMAKQTILFYYGTLAHVEMTQVNRMIEKAGHQIAHLKLAPTEEGT